MNKTTDNIQNTLANIDTEGLSWVERNFSHPERTIRLATSFSGIGAIEYAFKRLGLKSEIVFAGDIDANCKKAYFANYPIKEEQWHTDIHKLDATPYKGKVDLFVGGAPCQAFSIVGEQRGFEDTRGTLFREFARVVKECQPKVFIFENVQGLFKHDKVRTRFNQDGISIPQNLIVVGTVNMDETTFSFSRKVLDRAMTIEMNEVDLHGGLTKRHESIGKLGNAELVGSAVEGVDVYDDYTDVCDTALGYLQKVNDVLEGTPFKIAYRTRNEFLLYVINNLPYNKDKDGNDLPHGYVIARALDEITSMKILSRIEGDDTKVKDSLLNALSQTITDGLNILTDEDHLVKSVSVAKLEEMKNRLQSGYTSFWS